MELDVSCHVVESLPHNMKSSRKKMWAASVTAGNINHLRKTQLYAPICCITSAEATEAHFFAQESSLTYRFSVRPHKILCCRTEKFLVKLDSCGKKWASVVSVNIFWIYQLFHSNVLGIVICQVFQILQIKECVSLSIHYIGTNLAHINNCVNLRSWVLCMESD